MKPNSQKQLLMVDSSGSYVSLKLGTSAGLHYYDGQMLWVNPAATVTASAPRQPLTSVATTVTSTALNEKKTKAVPIIDPTTNEEIIIKTKEPEKKEEETSATPSPPAPPLAQISQVPVVATPTVSTLVANPQLGVTYVSSPVQVTSIQNLYKLSQAVPLTAPQQTRSVLDLFAKATSQSPQTILSASNIIQRGETKLPPNLQNEEDDRRKGRGKQNGRGNGRGAPAKSTNARGSGGRGNAQQSRGKPKEQGPIVNPKDYVDAKYTASLDGRFWCLSEWPTGERDEQHSLGFGKHKLPVESNGVIRVVLYGGVNRYKVKLHLATDADPLGKNDPEGWCVCTCAPNATDVQLTQEAIDNGWRVHSPSGELPSLYPPSIEIPTNNDAKSEEIS